MAVTVTAHLAGRRATDGLLWWSKLCGAILATAGVVALCWGTLAVPEIDRRVDMKINPVIEVMEYQNFLIMEQMPDDKVRAAEQKYTSYKRARIQK